MFKKNNLLSILILLLFNACNSSYSYLSFYDDKVLKNQRNMLTIELPNSDFTTKLIKVRKIFLKRINKKKEISYEMFDEFYFKKGSYNISDSFFMVLNDSISFKFKINSEEFKNLKNITYSKKMTFNFRIPIDNKTVEQMKTAKKIYFQYYSGPSIIKLDLPKHIMLNYYKFLND